MMALKELSELVKALCSRSEVSNNEVQQLKKALVALEQEDPTSLPDLEFARLVQGCLLLLSSGQQAVRQAFQLEVLKTTLLEPLYNNDMGKDHGSLRKSIADGQFVERLTSQLKKVVEDGSLDWVDTWVISLRLFSEGKGLNSILSVIEKAFRVGKSSKKKEYLEEVLNAWRQFIMIFAPRPKAQTNVKLMKVLVEPLLHINIDSVDLCKLNTWQTLTETLSSQSRCAATTVVVPFLDFLSEKEKLRRQEPDLVADCLLYMSETEVIASTCSHKIVLCFELLLHTSISRHKLLTLWQSLLELHKNRLSEAESLMNIVMKLSVEDELRELMLVRMKCLMSYKDSSGVELLKLAVTKIFPKEMTSEIFRSRVLVLYFTQLIDEAEATSREKENSEMFSSLHEMWKCLSDVYCEFVNKAPSDSFTCHDFNIITCVLSTPLYLPLKMFEKAVGALKAFGKIICSRVSPVEFSTEVINQVEDGVKQSIIPVSNCVSAAVIFKDLGVVGVSQWVSCVSREITGGRPQDILLFLKMLDQALPSLPHRVVFKPPLNCLVRLSPSYQPPYNHSIKTLAVKVLRKLSSYDSDSKNTSAGQTEAEEKTARCPRLSQSTFQLRLSKAESKKQKKFVSPSSLFPGARGQDEVSPGASPAASPRQGSVDSPLQRTCHVSPGHCATSGRPPTSPGRPTLSPGLPAASPGHPAASPGHPAASPGHPTASPGRPALSPGRPARSPGRGPTLPKITECRITSDLHPSPAPVSSPLDPGIKLSPTSAFNQAKLSTKSVAGKKRHASRSPSPGESPAPKRVASPTPKRRVSPSCKSRAAPEASPLRERPPVSGSPTPLLKLSPGSSFVRKFDPVSEAASSRSYVTVTRGRPKSLSRSFSADDSQDVFVAPVSSGGKRLLTEHQKEVLRERKDDIPALYQDLSQDTLSFSQDSLSLLENSYRKEEWKTGIDTGKSADEDEGSKDMLENSEAGDSDGKHGGSGRIKKPRDFKRLGFEAPGQFWQFEGSSGRRSSSKYRKSISDEIQSKPSSGNKKARKSPSGQKESEVSKSTCISDKDDTAETVKTLAKKRVSKLTSKADGSEEKRNMKKSKTLLDTPSNIISKVIPTIDQGTQVDLKDQQFDSQKEEKIAPAKKRGRKPKKKSKSLSKDNLLNPNETTNETSIIDSENEISLVFNISEEKTDMEVVDDKVIEDEVIVDKPNDVSNLEEVVILDASDKTELLVNGAQKEITEPADVSLAKAEVELLKKEEAGSQELSESGNQTPPSGRRRKRSNNEVQKFSPKLLRRRSLSLYKSPEKKTPTPETQKLQITDHEVLAVSLDQVQEVKQIPIKRKTPDATMEVVTSPKREESAKKPCLEEMTVPNVTPGVLTSAQHISNNATKPRRQSLMHGWLMTGKLSIMKKEEKEDSQDIVESSQEPVASLLSGSPCSEVQSDTGLDTQLIKRPRPSVYVSSPQSKRYANSLISQAIKPTQSWPVGSEEDWVVRSPAGPSASPCITILKHSSAYSPTKSPAPSAKKRVSFMYPLTTKGLKFTPDKFPSEGKIHRALSSPVSPPVKKSISIRGREVSLTSPVIATTSPEGKGSYSWGRIFKEDSFTSERGMPLLSPSDTPQEKRSDGQVVCQVVQVVGQPNGKEVVLLVDSVLVHPVRMPPPDSSVPEASQDQPVGSIPIEENTSEVKGSSCTEEAAESKIKRENSVKESHSSAESDRTCAEEASQHKPQDEHFVEDTDSSSAMALQHLPVQNSTLTGSDDSKTMDKSNAIICEDLNSSSSDVLLTHSLHPSDSTILEQPLDTKDSIDQVKLSQICDVDSGQAQISEPSPDSSELLKETELPDAQDAESAEITSKGSENEYIVSEGDILEVVIVSNGTTDEVESFKGDVVVVKETLVNDKGVEADKDEYKVGLIGCGVPSKSSEVVLDSEGEVVLSSGLSSQQIAETVEVEANGNIHASLPSAQDEVMDAQDEAMDVEYEEDLVVIRPFNKKQGNDEPLESVIIQKNSVTQETGEIQEKEFLLTVSSHDEPDCNESESESVSVSVVEVQADSIRETGQENLCQENSSCVESSKLANTVEVPVVSPTCNETLRPAVMSVGNHQIVSDSSTSDRAAPESHLSDVPARVVINSSESAHLNSFPSRSEIEGVSAEKNCGKDLDEGELVVECTPFPNKLLTKDRNVPLPERLLTKPTVEKDVYPVSGRQGVPGDKMAAVVGCGGLSGPVSCMTTLHGGGSLVSGEHGSGRQAGSTVGQVGASRSVSGPSGTGRGAPTRQPAGASSRPSLPPGITPQHAFLLQLISNMSGRNASPLTPPSTTPQPHRTAPPSTSSSSDVKMEVAEVENRAAGSSQVNGGWIPSASELDLMSATSQHLWKLKTGTSPGSNPSDMLQAVRSLRTTQGTATEYFDMLFSQVFVAVHRLEKKLDLVLNQFKGNPPN